MFSSQGEFCRYLICAHLSSCRHLACGRRFTLRSSNYKVKFVRAAPKWNKICKVIHWEALVFSRNLPSLQGVPGCVQWWLPSCHHWRWLDSQETSLTLGSAQQPKSLTGVTVIQTQQGQGEPWWDPGHGQDVLKHLSRELSTTRWI